LLQVWSLLVLVATLFCVRPVKQGGGKMCKPTKNQFLYCSWDLGREIDPAFAIVAASGLYTSQQV